MFTNSGAEAVENAVKIARYFTKRQGVVVFDHAFHGRTLLAMTMTAKAMPYKKGLGPFAPEVYRLPFSYPYRCPMGGESPEACAERCADYAIDHMDKQIGPENIACACTTSKRPRDKMSWPAMKYCGSGIATESLIIRRIARR